MSMIYLNIQKMPFKIKCRYLYTIVNFKLRTKLFNKILLLSRIRNSNSFSFSYPSSRDNMLPSDLHLNSMLTCRLVGGLSREQRSVCHETPDAAAIAFEGLELAVRECQHQFRWHRWNCSSLAVKSSNPHGSGIMKRGKLTDQTMSLKFLLAQNLRREEGGTFTMRK